MKNQQGSAMIIVILLLLSITALGLIALRMTQIELISTGNYKLQKQAYYISESAMVNYINFVSSFSETFNTEMSTLICRYNYPITPSFFDLNPDGSFGKQTLNVETYVTTCAAGEVTAQEAGFEANWCSKMYTFTATGYIGNVTFAKSEAGTAGINDFFSNVSMKSHARIGRYKCGQ